MGVTAPTGGAVGAVIEPDAQAHISVCEDAGGHGRHVWQRGVAKLRERAPQARPSWGDRRLNRKKRFALADLLASGLSHKGPLLGEPHILRLAGLYALPVSIVEEAVDRVGRRFVSLVLNAA